MERNFVKIVVIEVFKGDVMGEIIKIANLELLCVPKFVKSKKKEKIMITRFELTNGEKVHFVNNHRKLHFRHMSTLGLGFVNGNKIRYFKHDKDPKHKFYMQAIYIELFNKMNLEGQKQFYSLSDSKGDTTCTGVGVFEAMGIDHFNPGSFDSDKLTKVFSDDGWLVEVDITKYIDSIML